eukprot:5266546-Karenia_brevis.AAC.1
MPRQKYTEERMRAVAERSMVDYLPDLGGTSLLHNVRCEYEGVAQADGTYDPQAPIRQRSRVGFRWSGDCDGYQSVVTELRPDHAVSRG